MDARTLINEFEYILAADGGIARVRQLILHLAVSGRLGKREFDDTPAKVLIEENQDHQRSLMQKRRLKRQPAPASISADKAPWSIPEGWEWTRLGTVTNYGDAPKREYSDVQPDTWVLELEDIEKATSRLVTRAIARDRHFKSTKNAFPCRRRLIREAAALPG
jgi:type I restriction enzyme S subunit